MQEIWILYLKPHAYRAGKWSFMERDLTSEERAHLMTFKSSNALWITASKVALILWVLSRIKAEAVDPPPEIEALLEFKAAVSIQTGSDDNPFEPRGFWYSWKATDRHPCNWVGVSCTADFRVQGIDLSGWGLTRLYGFGSLRTLGSLERLDLSSNNFKADIYEDIGTLTGLTHLDLSGSSFEGIIPSTISQLWNLRYLSLAGNGLRGDIPQLNNLTKLQVLSLAQNQLTGRIPEHLGNLTTLVSFDLSNNLLNGSIPVLEHLINLVELNLNNNTLTDFKDPQSPAPKNLEHLSISGNQIVGSLPSGLVNLLNLKSLDLSFNDFSGTIPKGLSRQENHSFWLDLSHNQLTGSIPQDLFQSQASSSVMSLNLSYNLLTGSIPWPEVKPSDFAGWNFDTLDISHNQFPYTRELRLANNLFSGDLTNMVGRWGSLALRMELVDISNNLLSMSKTEDYPDPMRATLEAFLAMFVLREFRIAGNGLVGISLPNSFLRVGNLPTLEVLDLSNNHIVGSIVADAFDPATFPSLKVLNISSNNLTGPIPSSLTRLPKLSSLDVSWNNLSGEVPAIPENSSLWNPDFFSGNPGLCGGPLPACSSSSPPPAPTFIIIEKNVVKEGMDLSWWLLLIIIASSVLVPQASCLVVCWRWRVYKDKHQHDADMIATSNLLERDTAELMPLRELKRATDNFADGAQIGAGGFGTVYTGKLNDGTMVAIKRSKREGSEDDKQRFLNEVRILSQVNHRYLVKLLGCCMENKVALLVFEYISNGTLQEHLQGKKGSRRLSWKERLHIAVQGTMGYVDPEYYTSFQLTGKSDVYSFGVVLLELISAQSAIDFQRGPGDASLVTFAASQIKSGDWKGMIDPVLVKSCDYQAERESIMSVGNLALRCVEMRSKDRPEMKVVWNQLQTLWHRCHGTSDSLESILFELPDADEKISESVDSSTVLYSSLQDVRTDSSGSQHGDIEMSRSF
ncbi:protein MpRLK-Pelle_WAK_LRK10L-6 [Marchantia polymorpha subsp. ruderalis]|uniref:non-specific serine/threonine protein kinase n=1 Tax=Marchantia polymorpha TaxID=3197 RepID=A0A2R6X1F9_MARPO|nr:hypothetical protein MARPO_0042s0003 [Marchantia polymorpha]BBN02228.1 hypothetical protein Mp_2g13740 [Marchantia polymorpha subsp. ruderalis]|eukprot:PTQ39930.1 hypothetical protein MARPO_0042s0003 [Marchantia polymorpha]